MECARSSAVEPTLALLGLSGGCDRGTQGNADAAQTSTGVASNSGHTALHYAAFAGHTAAVHALLQAGWDTAVLNGRGESPQQSALAGGHEHTSSVLAAWGVAQAAAAATAAATEQKRQRNAAYLSPLSDSDHEVSGLQAFVQFVLMRGSGSAENECREPVNL
jgi:hypothetical protein